MDELLLGVIWYAALLFSLTFHEAAHAWVALRGGDPTAYLGGQVSLDPRPHVRREPLGTVFVPVFFYALNGWMLGWASTPYDPRWAEAHPRRASWMSLAGPISNFALVLLAAAVIRFGIAADVFYAPEFVSFTHLVAASPGIWEAASTLLSVLFTLNLLLGVFNLIPVPPLDGAGVVGLLLSDESARRMRHAFAAQPYLSVAGIVVAWLLIGPLFGPIHLAAVNLLYPELSYG